jgi:MSHA biogenesis protein MshI
MLQAMKNFLMKRCEGAAEVLGIEIKPTGIAVACLSIRSGSLTALEYRACGPGEWQGCLKDMVKAHSLSGKAAFFTLHPKFYDMLLVDAPDVDDAELSDAVRWRVKDLIAHPIDDVVVDVFRLPPAAYRGRMNMVYTSIVERKVVQSIVEAAEDAGLDLQSIGINDLSICQYGKHIEGIGSMGIAFITLGQRGGVINLTESGLLYLSRSIEIGLESLTPGEAVSELTVDTGSRTDALALDIQRSMDYYESQLGMAGVGRIIFMPTNELLHQVAADLENKVSAGLEVLNLSESFSIEEGELDIANFCFNAIGAALAGSEEQVSHTMKGGASGKAVLTTG